MRYFLAPRCFLKIAILSFLFVPLCCVRGYAQSVLWKIGENDRTVNDMALAPENYADFLPQDFGWEDRFFLIGFSNVKKDWSYVLPGPGDGWGGTSLTSGLRSSVLNILFGVNTVAPQDDYKLVITLLDADSQAPPLLKVTVKGQSWKFNIPPGATQSPELDSLAYAKGYTITLPIPQGLIAHGGNEVQLTTLSGKWLMFDQVRLEGPAQVSIQHFEKAFLRNVAAAPYEIETNGTRAQPLLVDVEHLSGAPVLLVKYEIGSPLFEKIEIDLGNRYGRGKTFTIEARHASRANMFIQRASLNGKKLSQSWFYASELLKGGTLVLDMGDQPNKKWGIKTPPVAH